MAEAENPQNNQAQPASAAQPTAQAQEPAKQETASHQSPVQVTAEQAQKTVEQAQKTAEKAQQAAGQVAGGVMQGVDKLKQTGIASMFKKAENQPAVTMEEKAWAAIAYIPLAALAALVIKPDSAYVKLHGRQGLLIFIVFFLCIFVYLVPFIGPMFGGLIQLGLFILGIFSMYQALIGNWWKIPMMGDLSEAIPLSLFEKVTKEVVTGQAAPQEPQTTETPKDQPPAAQ
jgi:uncharacterized membrane protein